MNISLLRICQFVDRIKKELVNVIIIKEMNEEIISFSIVLVLKYPLIH